MWKNKNSHRTVMLQQIIDIVNPNSNKTILDCTFGGGGHAKAMLKQNATVFSIDRDYRAVLLGRTLEEEEERFNIRWSLFSELHAHFIPRTFDIVLFDLGLSSNQLNVADFGMSFLVDQPLSMCMGRNNRDAYRVVNFTPEKELANIIYEFGEERASFRIAKRIVERRKKNKIKTTLELAKIISSVIPRHDRHPATRTFQAIRIYVNNELEEIQRGLEITSNLCKIGGMMLVISFHSLEDRIVKLFFKQFPERSGVILPSPEEVKSNVRARSAKLRWCRV
jgi:16S rRNA (cytosine1402-N4)-methyltransferase